MAATPVLKLPDDAEIIRPVSRHQSAHDVMNAHDVMAAFGQMRRLGWIALGYQIAAIALLGSLMGGSQSMKTELLENL